MYTLPQAHSASPLLAQAYLFTPPEQLPESRLTYYKNRYKHVTRIESRFF